MVIHSSIEWLCSSCMLLFLNWTRHRSGLRSKKKPQLRSTPSTSSTIQRRWLWLWRRDAHSLAQHPSKRLQGRDFAEQCSAHWKRQGPDKQCRTQQRRSRESQRCWVYTLKYLWQLQKGCQKAKLRRKIFLLRATEEMRMEPVANSSKWHCLLRQRLAIILPGVRNNMPAFCNWSRLCSNWFKDLSHVKSWIAASGKKCNWT